MAVGVVGPHDDDDADASDASRAPAAARVEDLVVEAAAEVAAGVVEDGFE